jgi:hypothetical protein
MAARERVDGQLELPLLTRVAEEQATPSHQND